jgi:hypothetical protein
MGGAYCLRASRPKEDSALTWTNVSEYGLTYAAKKSSLSSCLASEILSMSAVEPKEGRPKAFCSADASAFQEVERTDKPRYEKY